jgi:hypothetical protein
MSLSTLSSCATSPSISLVSSSVQASALLELSSISSVSAHQYDKTLKYTTTEILYHSNSTTENYTIATVKLRFYHILKYKIVRDDGLPCSSSLLSFSAAIMDYYVREKNVWVSGDGYQRGGRS